MKSMRRVLKYDGILPTKMVGRKHVKVEPEDIRLMKSWIEENRSETTPFDIVVEGKTQGDDSDECFNVVNPWFEAGATWWIEAMWDAMDKKNSNELFVKRIRQGPPTI